MHTTDFTTTLTTLFAELVDGAPRSGAYMLNGGDPGLLRSLDKLSAAAASATPSGGSSIAAHVDHLRYGLSLTRIGARAGERPASPKASGNSCARNCGMRAIFGSKLSVSRATSARQS